MQIEFNSDRCTPETRKNIKQIEATTTIQQTEKNIQNLS